MKIYTITPTLKLIYLEPSILTYSKMLGAYLFCGEKNAIVDIGPKYALPNLLQALAELNLSPKAIDYILLTHIHIDHAGGVGTVLKEMTSAKILAHSKAVPHLIDPTRLWKASLKTLGDTAVQCGDIEPIPENRIITAIDQMKLDLGGGLVLDIYLTPGHAAHHLSIFDEVNGVLIAGEAAGVCLDGVLRLTTPPPFKLEETLSSIDKLIELSPQKLCYAHLGCYDNGVERLKLYREKLLLWHKVVKSAAKTSKSPEDILALLRNEDKSLNYLDRLNKDEYDREAVLLTNSIIGLAGSV